MHRCCASRGVDAFADVHEFLGSEERRLIRELRAAEAELLSEREAVHRAFENVEICRGELRESESERQQERSSWRAQLAARTMEVVRREQTIYLEARREVAEARSKCESETSQSFIAGAHKGEEVMLAQMIETSQSLRDQLHIAEEARVRTALELTAEGCEFSRYKEDTAQEMEALRKELMLTRAQRDIYYTRASRMQNRSPSTKQEGGFSNNVTTNVDGARHDCSDTDTEKRVTTGNGSVHRAVLSSAIAGSCDSYNTIDTELSNVPLPKWSANTHGSVQCRH